MLFEPDREDADMFFANIFSYSQRKRLCAAAYAQDAAEPDRARAHDARAACSRGTASRSAATGSPTRTATSPTRVTDPRPLRARRRDASDVRQTTRDLAHTLDQLERWLARAR